MAKRRVEDESEVSLVTADEPKFNALIYGDPGAGQDYARSFGAGPSRHAERALRQHRSRAGERSPPR